MVVLRLVMTALLVEKTGGSKGLLDHVRGRRPRAGLAIERV